MKTEKTFIIHPQTTEKENAKTFVKVFKLDFEITKNRLYNPEFVTKIKRSRKDYEEGKGRKTSLEKLNDLWK